MPPSAEPGVSSIPGVVSSDAAGHVWRKGETRKAKGSLPRSASQERKHWTEAQQRQESDGQFGRRSSGEYGYLGRMPGRRPVRRECASLRHAFSVIENSRVSNGRVSVGSVVHGIMLSCEGWVTRRLQGLPTVQNPKSSLASSKAKVQRIKLLLRQAISAPPPAAMPQVPAMRHLRLQLGARTAKMARGIATSQRMTMTRMPMIWRRTRTRQRVCTLHLGLSM